MHYLFNVIDSQSATGTDAEMAAIDAFNTQLTADGRLIFAGGLSAPSHARLVDNRDGRGHVEHGPLHDAPEFVSGLWIVDAPDDDTAMRLAADASRACNRRLEVRPYL